MVSGLVLKFKNEKNIWVYKTYIQKEKVIFDEHMYIHIPRNQARNLKC